MSDVFYEVLENARMEKIALSAADMARIAQKRGLGLKPSLNNVNALKKRIHSGSNVMHNALGRANPSVGKAQLHAAAKSLRG